MWRWILAILFFLLYLRSPIDLIPDFIQPIGFLDDIGVLAIIWWYLRKKAREEAAKHFSKIQAEEEQRAQEHQNGAGRNNHPPDPYEVLRVPPSASREEIEKAYKTLMKQYHPDRVHGLGEELQEVARKKSQEINAAYQALK